MRPANKLVVKGGAIEVERVHHHSDMRFRLKKGLMGTAVASGAKQPRRPSATLVKGHYDDAPAPMGYMGKYGELTDKGFEEFDNAKDAIKWAKENVYAFDYLKERKDTWEILFEELLVWIGKGEVVEC